jgi:hypothetical protein
MLRDNAYIYRFEALCPGCELDVPLTRTARYFCLRCGGENHDLARPSLLVQTNTAESGTVCATGLITNNRSPTLGLMQ